MASSVARCCQAPNAASGHLAPPSPYSQTGGAASSEAQRLEQEGRTETSWTTGSLTASLPASRRGGGRRQRPSSKQQKKVENLHGRNGSKGETEGGDDPFVLDRNGSTLALCLQTASRISPQKQLPPPARRDSPSPPAGAPERSGVPTPPTASTPRHSRQRRRSSADHVGPLRHSRGVGAPHGSGGDDEVGGRAPRPPTPPLGAAGSTASARQTAATATPDALGGAAKRSPARDLASATRRAPPTPYWRGPGRQ